MAAILLFYEAALDRRPHAGEPCEAFLRSHTSSKILNWADIIYHNPFKSCSIQQYLIAALMLEIICCCAFTEGDLLP
jgi:hypothetical protein